MSRIPKRAPSTNSLSSVGTLSAHEPQWIEEIKRSMEQCESIRNARKGSLQLFTDDAVCKWGSFLKRDHFKEEIIDCTEPPTESILSKIFGKKTAKSKGEKKVKTSNVIDQSISNSEVLPLGGYLAVFDVSLNEEVLAPMPDYLREEISYIDGDTNRPACGFGVHVAASDPNPCSFYLNWWGIRQDVYLEAEIAKQKLIAEQIAEKKRQEILALELMEQERIRREELETLRKNAEVKAAEERAKLMDNNREKRGYDQEDHRGDAERIRRPYSPMEARYRHDPPTIQYHNSKNNNSNMNTNNNGNNQHLHHQHQSRQGQNQSRGSFGKDNRGQDRQPVDTRDRDRDKDRDRIDHGHHRQHRHEMGDRGSQSSDKVHRKSDMSQSQSRSRSRSRSPPQKYPVVSMVDPVIRRGPVEIVRSSQDDHHHQHQHQQHMGGDRYHRGSGPTSDWDRNGQRDRGERGDKRPHPPTMTDPAKRSGSHANNSVNSGEDRWMPSASVQLRSSHYSEKNRNYDKQYSR